MSNESFSISLAWQSQNKNFTYQEYSREYTIKGQGKPELTGTAAPGYQGSKQHYNPEDLLIASLSACHMLFYLAIAANSKITVLSYEDNPQGELHQEGKTTKFKQVTLKPKVTISSDSDMERAKAIHEKAHHGCFIANSVNFEINVEPEIYQE